MRVIMVDDHRSFRESFAMAVAQRGAITIVGYASGAREGCGLIEATKPDLAVVDISLQESDGISLVRELKRRRIDTPILILTMHGSGLYVRDALDAGARGYALKDQPLGEVIDAMNACQRGEQYLSPLVDPLPPSDRPASDRGEREPSLFARLSRREKEIAAQVIRGKSSQEIATSLCISLKTVETHRAHINRKLGVHSTAEIIRLAAQMGLLDGQPLVSAGAAVRAGAARQLD
jgi:DNA-binding NarL/FixJ family response regulator